VFSFEWAKNQEQGTKNQRPALLSIFNHQFYPVQFFAEDERSGFNWGDNLQSLWLGPVQKTKKTKRLKPCFYH